MSQHQLPVVWSPLTRRHDPDHEVWVGTTMPAVEVAARVDAILDALSGNRLVEATACPDDVLRRVHHPALLDWLRTAARRWDAGEYVAEAGQDRVVP